MSDLIRSKILNEKCKRVYILSKYTKAFRDGLYSSMPLNYQIDNGMKYIDVELKILNVTSRGKKIVFILENNVLFISGCGMTGTWNYEYSQYTALILQFENCHLYYDEVRIGGNFSICINGSSEYQHIFKDVGPDLMTEEVNWEIYYKILKNPRISHMEICEFMMEQKYLSGIGNYLRAEILYYCRLNPHRTISSLSEQDLYNLFYYSKVIIWETYKNNGLTIKDYTSPDGKIGTYSCKCYGREYDENGYQIIKEKGKNDRSISWCPSLQF